VGLKKTHQRKRLGEIWAIDQQFMTQVISECIPKMMASQPTPPKRTPPEKDLIKSLLIMGVP